MTLLLSLNTLNIPNKKNLFTRHYVPRRAAVTTFSVGVIVSADDLPTVGLLKHRQTVPEPVALACPGHFLLREMSYTREEVNLRASAHTVVMSS